jgi:hypothetical protein
MKPFKILIPLIFIFFVLACATAPDKGKEQPIQLFAVEGTVLDRSPSELLLTIQIPSFPKSADTTVANIAHQVVQKSYLLEGTKILIDGQEGTIAEVRANQVKLIFASTPAYTAGRKVSVGVPKKTIAVVDFEVIGGNRKEKGRVVLEGLTSALIDTGQFVVVERTKLQTVMNEIQLSLSGMARPTGDEVAGKLLIADLILTGTLTDMGDEWDINLRILNVRTGQALSAVSMRDRLFKPTEMRDAGPFAENFEGSRFDPSWIVRSEAKGAKKGKKANYSIHLDSTQGAEESHQSMRIDFDFSGATENDFYAMAGNRKKRDVTLYKGVEFSVKGTVALSGQFFILTSQPDDPNKMDKWTGFFDIDRTWKKIRIPFDEMVIARGWIKKGAQKQGATPGDQVMRLNRVEGIQFGIGSANNEGASGSIWIDHIRLYGD